MNDQRPMGLVFDMPFAEYLAVDALSNTAMKELARSPWHYRNRVNKPQTRPMLRGSLAHCAVLEPDAMAARYVVTPEDAPRRPTAAQWTAKKPSESSQQAMDWWTAFGQQAASREIITAEEFGVTQAQLAALAENSEIADTLRTGKSEVSVFWVDQATGVYCKARPDHVRPLTDGRYRLLDLKSVADESADAFGKAVARFGYHRQRAHYIAGFEASGRKVEEFVFAAVTSAPPVLAVPYILADEIAQQGADEVRELLELFARCTESGSWPPPGEGLQVVDVPKWAKRSNEEEVSFAS